MGISSIAGIGTVHSTHDVEAASAALSDSYAELTIRVPAKVEHFGMRLECLDLPDVQIAVLDLSSAWVRTVPYPNYTVCFPVRGRVEVGGGVGPRAVVVTDGRGVTVCPSSGELDVAYLSDDCRILTVTVGREALERELEVMLGRSLTNTIRFDFAFDVERCSSLQRSLAYVQAELADPSGLADHSLANRGLALQQLSRLLMSAILTGQRHDWSDELRRPAGFEGPRAIRLAVEAIADRPMDFATVTDIARAANLSVRALEAGFKRHLGTSPMAHVRSVRLARAHDELARAELGSTTATAVAQRWGFTHYGRFTAAYRQRFGCSPRQTLRVNASAGRSA